ncbi:MAG: hypothetical protein QMD43_06405 [Thermodesulfovibrio sp.]|nr:hypothetical protein [Thermodesulfovibrio sp.]
MKYRINLKDNVRQKIKEYECTGVYIIKANPMGSQSWNQFGWQ